MVILLHLVFEKVVIYLHSVHNFGGFVDADGQAVVVFSRDQDVFQGLSAALGTVCLGGGLDKNLLKSHGWLVMRQKVFHKGKK